jgi:hypothetical protein
LSEDLYGYPILLHSLQVTQPTYPLPLYPFYYIFSFFNSSISRFVLIFPSTSSYLGPYIQEQTSKCINFVLSYCNFFRTRILVNG